MSDGDLLLRAILDTPEDDTARLVYADWLDENGQPERAEFIRVQCRIAAATDGTRQLIRLRDVERGSLRNRWDDWCPQAKPNRPYTFSQPISHLIRVLHGDGEYMQIGFGRGFVESLTCTATDFLAHAAAIFRAHPVCRVTLSGKQSSRRVLDDPTRDEEWGWCYTANRHSYEEEGFFIPERLAPHLPGGRSWAQYWRVYDTEAEANDALSAACVNLGRVLARAELGAALGVTAIQADLK